MLFLGAPPAIISECYLEKVKICNLFLSTRRLIQIVFAESREEDFKHIFPIYNRYVKNSLKSQQRLLLMKSTRVTLLTFILIINRTVESLYKMIRFW